MIYDQYDILRFYEWIYIVELKCVIYIYIYIYKNISRALVLLVLEELPDKVTEWIMAVHKTTPDSADKKYYIKLTPNENWFLKFKCFCSGMF